MSTTTDLSVLKINYLTQAQYDNAKSQGTLNADEIYMTPVSNPGVEDVEVDGVSVVTDGVAEITMPTVPTKVSQLQNDSGYITGYTETDPTVPSWAKQSSKPSYTASEVGALPASTSIPSKTSDLTNDSNFVEDASYVHTDNNFTSTEKSKLSGIASGAEVNVQADWNVTSTSSDAYIKNKPTIPTVPSNVSAFTNDAGYLTSYTETDPTVPAWAKASSKPSYTASEVGAVPTSRKVNGKALTADITLSASDVSALPASTSIPSKVSDLQNDAGYITGYTETDPVFSASAASGITASHISQWNGITIGDYTEGLVDTIAHGYTALPNNGMSRSVSLLVNGGMFVGFMYRYLDTYGGGSLVKYDGTSCNVFINNGTVTAQYEGVVIASISAFSSLPLTISYPTITANHVCLKAELGTPSAQTGDWTVTTSAGSLTLSGSINGSTTAKLYLAVAQ